MVTCGCENKKTTTEPIFPQLPYDGPQEAIAIGDSLSKETAATKRMDELTSVIWENNGIGGNWTKHVLSRWNSDVTIKNPKYLLLIVGINDIYNNVPIETLKNNYLAIINHIKTEKLTAIISNIPYGEQENQIQKDKTLIINNWLSMVCADNNILLIDFYSWSLAHPELRDPDKIHFIIPTGYTKFTDYIYSQLPIDYFESENK